jgi:hypothetical protein
MKEQVQNQLIKRQDTNKYIGSATTLYAQWDKTSMSTNDGNNRFSPATYSWVAFNKGSLGGMYP